MRTLLTTLMVLAAIFVSTEALAQEPVQTQEQEQCLLRQYLIMFQQT